MINLLAFLSTWVISLIPYRKGEKWAWYFLLVVGGITNFGVLALTYTGTPSLLPLIILLFILWIAALALPAKEILGTPS